MNITFGIITYCENGANNFLIDAIKSIRDLNIPAYEIIIVGTAAHLNRHDIIGEDVIVLDFNERIRDKWITKKKNMITDKAKYDNIVYQHDYFAYNTGWYESWRDFGAFHVGMNRLINEPTGCLQNNVDTRYRDWSIFPHTGVVEKAINVCGFQGHECLIPYEETGFSKLQYISGGWWIAKKHVMEEFRLNESLCWGQGEDVEWSYRVRNKFNFSINKEASVRLLKYHHVSFSPMRQEVYVKMKDFLKQNNLYG
jgi:hypothetical protein